MGEGSVAVRSGNIELSSKKDERCCLLSSLEGQSAGLLMIKFLHDSEEWPGVHVRLYFRRGEAANVASK